MQFLVDTLSGFDSFSTWEESTIRLLLMVVIPLVAVQTVLFIAGLVSIIKKRADAINKALWIILLFVNLIGPIIYFAVGANMLDQKSADQEEGESRYE